MRAPPCPATSSAPPTPPRRAAAAAGPEQRQRRPDLAHGPVRRLGDEVSQITTPLLITEPEDEQFWPGQSQALYDRLPGPRELVRLTAAEGANRHCEPLGQATREARVFDWLDRYLAT